MRKLLVFFAVLAFALPWGEAFAAKIRGMSPTMSDETVGYPYYDAIEWGYESGVFDGYSDGANKGLFRPFGNITRAEFLKMLFNAKGEKIPDSYDRSCFSDSAVGTWYNKFLCYSKEKSYVNGYDDGTFRPNANVTVAEAYKILVNAYGFTAANDISDYTFLNQDRPPKASEYSIAPSKWYYRYFSITHEMGIRFDQYAFSDSCDGGQSGSGICDLDSALDTALTRGQMINLVYQFQGIQESEGAAEAFIGGMKDKTGSGMYDLLDSASRKLEVSSDRLAGIISGLPMKVSSVQFKGAYFYNGIYPSYNYEDLSGNTYSHNALRLGYDLYVKLGDGSGTETVKLEFYPVFVLEDGSWKFHEEAHRFYSVAISEESPCATAVGSRISGFLGYLLVESPSSSSAVCPRMGNDKQKNMTETV
ncbi:MAG TPA: S-layer homology domain-containing protein [bacterium]|nr:S-layer homology domain-containing protein [bacterium]